MDPQFVKNGVFMGSIFGGPDPKDKYKWNQSEGFDAVESTEYWVAARFFLLLILVRIIYELFSHIIL